MTSTLEIGTVLALALAMIGCYKYVHDRAAHIYEGQVKFTEGWNEWRMAVVHRLTRIETILESDHCRPPVNKNKNEDEP